MENSKKLNKLEKSWILYDVGNSAFILLVTTLIPIYYKNIATNTGISLSDSTAYYSYALSLSTVIIAILGPILGGIADNNSLKKRLFTFFMMMGVIGCAALSIPKSCILLLVIFVIAKIGFSGSLIFYDAILVDITDYKKMDKVSSYGYALGYIGSCIPFIISLALVLNSDKLGLSKSIAMTIAFSLNAIWWILCSLPLLKNYKEKKAPSSIKIKGIFISLINILKEIKKDKRVLYFLVAFFFYIDGVYTIIDMASSYGKDVGLTDSSMLIALLVTQIVAFPFALLFGILSKKFDSKKLITFCIGGYFLITIFALTLDREWEFWLMAILVGTLQGGIQALSRSYFAKIIPKEKSAEYFGLYDIFGKGASFIGTLLMGVFTQIFNTSKAGVVVIAIMFLIGLITFSKKDNSNSIEIEVNE